MNVYGGWANDEQTRIDAASGGGFSGLKHKAFSTCIKKIKLPSLELHSQTIEYIIN